MAKLDISVIIPTFNRILSLRETLHSLSCQTYPMNSVEVIVIDDGSTDGTGEIRKENFPFIFRYEYQINQGDAAARNRGAQLAYSDVLLFIDDDILVEPYYISSILQEYSGKQNVIVMGTEHNWVMDNSSPFQSFMNTESIYKDNSQPTFDKLCSNNMSIKRDAYIKIGMMHSMGFQGSDIWCDVDFAFRAYNLGFEFRRSPSAVCYHKDYNLSNRLTYQNRIKVAAKRSVILFNKCPGLLDYLPMFTDKKTGFLY